MEEITTIALLSKNQLDWTSDWTSDWNGLVTEIVTQLLGCFRSKRTVVIGAAFFEKISFYSKILSHFCWILVPNHGLEGM